MNQRDNVRFLRNVLRGVCCLIAICVVVAASSGNAFGLGYTIQFDPKNPLTASVTFELPESDSRTQTLVQRGAKWGLESQVIDVRADGNVLPSESTTEWTIPAGTRVVTWKITFDDASIGPVHLARQRNVFFRNGDWWLVSESTSLLRLEDTDSASVSIQPESTSLIGGSLLSENQWTVPPIRGAPEFFVIGHKNPLRIEVNGWWVTHVADDKDRVNALGLPEAHRSTIEYLLSLFPASSEPPQQDRHLTIVWAGLNSASGQIGGAAGGRSFLANYLYGESLSLSDGHAANLMVVAHEQFHQLTARYFPRAAPPVWVNESLAHYYGIKSLSKTKLPFASIDKTRIRFVDPKRPIEKPLVDLSRQFARGDRSVYPLFYTQGATFWAEVDDALVRSSNSEKSLDDFLGVVLNAKYDASSDLPSDVRELLRSQIGSQFDEIADRYVSSQTSGISQDDRN